MNPVKIISDHISNFLILLHNPAFPKTVRVRHFTNRKGMECIKEAGIIRAGDQNRVFTVRARGKPGSPRDVERQLGIRRGRGNYYVEFDASADEFEIVKNLLTGSTETVFKGDVVLRERNPEFRSNR
ncbi:HYD1 signature containing ADP-ribosyltransferase family protein [Desulfonema magnum]|uniref:Toxin domain-containing protein n=1 Tax=Desulfonema magnum TaxID=45655 RepID=A0A975BKY6_9BACT|nr:HYD1 signature containing ADP-ribosyltransferase family protein [Desulfonema magnum]QTA87033.1 toxin domain-containing protein [Desulfonema magnum]